jgi:hypothetical protein
MNALYEIPVCNSFCAVVCARHIHNNDTAPMPLFHLFPTTCSSRLTRPFSKTCKHLARNGPWSTGLALLAYRQMKRKVGMYFHLLTRGLCLSTSNSTCSSWLLFLSQRCFACCCPFSRQTQDLFDEDNYAFRTHIRPCLSKLARLQNECRQVQMALPLDRVRKKIAVALIRSSYRTSR